MLFTDKVALVTGATRGIGAATARAFAEAGAAVVIAARDVPALERVAADVAPFGGQALVVRADVTDEQDVEQMVRQAVSRFGGLHAAVNCAGGGPSRMVGVADLAPADLDAALALNLGGAFLAMRHEIPAILASGGGAIVNISSGAGLRAPAPGTAPYVTSKHALQGMTKVAALDYADRGVRINAIAPGPIDTDILAGAGEEGRRWAAQTVPMRRIGRPEEVAAAAVWLCSDQASFITGATLAVDGGLAAT